MYLLKATVTLEGVELPDDSNIVKTTYRARVIKGENEGEVIIRTEGKRVIGGIVYDYVILRTYAPVNDRITQGEIDLELESLPDLNDKIFEGFGDDLSDAHKVN